ncbi:hypothetical protein TPEGhana051_0461a [Treponema pallidum subsp. pertenue]|nr:hypothetical protein TPESAMD_0461a [Treponema pallidum subsp. pertenue str. SamoaD]AEZ58655.1 hypothetical protein TPECDC2_0461a [Treponema pallidum subsp. pertenue str. CDC2]ASV58115.1 hypothetical protein TPEGhana051_0461a [Treponema pallidum subsp. pertenue]ASV59178.1 hypothetical protein TPECDC2575_0461a [Treponema pallidum subsp. pertenue]AYE90809.1 hypothetical protein TPESGK403_0461a [Treponema pallidum subsp. pertenue]
MDYSSFQSFPLFPPITALMQTWHVPAPITGTETPPRGRYPRHRGGGIGGSRASSSGCTVS